MTCSLAPSITIFDFTPSFLNIFLAEWCAWLLLDMGSILIHSVPFVQIWAHVLPLVDFMEEKYVSVNIVVFNLRYLSCRSLVRKCRCKLGWLTALTPCCVVTLVVWFAVVGPLSHFSANASGETPFHIVDEVELIFTWSSNDDVKASILKCGLGVGVVVFGQSFKVDKRYLIYTVTELLQEGKLSKFEFLRQ